MNATDELRQLLDERGVEHYDGVESTLWLKDEHGYRASADELTSGRMSVHIWCETPEQAIAATLGRGECRFVTVVDKDSSRRHRGNIAECDCCGYRCAIGFIQDERFRYCPNCGAKVVDE